MSKIKSKEEILSGMLDKTPNTFSIKSLQAFDISYNAIIEAMESYHSRFTWEAQGGIWRECLTNGEEDLRLSPIGWLGTLLRACNRKYVYEALCKDSGGDFDAVNIMLSILKNFEDNSINLLTQPIALPAQGYSIDEFFKWAFKEYHWNGEAFEENTGHDDFEVYTPSEVFKQFNSLTDKKDKL